MVSTKFATLITAFGIVVVCSKSSEEKDICLHSYALSLGPLKLSSDP